MPAPVPPSMRRSPASVQHRLFRQQHLWRQLTAYRPLMVLGGIWLGLLAIALLAFGQLTHNAPDQPSAAAPTTPYPHERVNGSSEESAAPVTSPEAQVTAPAAIEETDVQSINGLSIWTMVALVASCASGCWLLSILLKMPRRPKKRRPQRSRVAKSDKRYRLTASQRPPVAAPLSASKDTPVATVPKLETYNPDQPLVASSQPAKSPPSPPPTPETPASEVTVVSAETQHQLDWPRDSLVNTADVRQQRSLSSFM